MDGLSLLEVLFIAAAGALAGAVNAVAGGGSLLSFPALLAVGYAPVTANATNIVALVPGYVGGAYGYRRELRGQGPRARFLSVISVAGAAAGSLLLVLGPASVFKRIAPVLVLLACALLAAQPWLARVAESRRAREEPHRGVEVRAGVFLGAVYGGYFGAGLGIMLLALLASLIDDDLQRLNALKALLSLVISIVAALLIALFGPVRFGPAAVMAVTSLAGGHVGASFARRLRERPLRIGIVVYGTALAVWLFLR